jgi:hypothetical protein
MMAVVLHGFSILKYMVTYPCLSAEEKENITFVDDGENLNLRAVMAHIMGKHQFPTVKGRRPFRLD